MGWIMISQDVLICLNIYTTIQIIILWFFEHYKLKYCTNK